MSIVTFYIFLAKGFLFSKKLWPNPTVCGIIEVLSSGGVCVPLGTEGAFMKLILAIINRDDAGAVTQNLTKRGFSSTKLSTTGGFLLAGNVTVLVGVDEEKVQAVIDVIKEHSHSRKQMIPASTEVNYGYYPSMPVEVTVGGATIFVVDIERFERV